MDELFEDFLTETADNISSLDHYILLLENDPDNVDILGHIFRHMHTIKGCCGFMGLPQLQHLTHLQESILGHIRTHQLKVTPSVINLLLEGLDRMKLIIKELKTHRKEPLPPDETLIHKLILASQGGQVASKERAKDPAVNANTGVGKKEATMGEEKEDASVRVPLMALETLSRTVKEVISVCQRLRVANDNSQDPLLTPLLQQLQVLIPQLQKAMNKTKRQPVKQAWSQLPRLIRDLNLELGKEIDLAMQGGDTEVDRYLVKALHDPLTHMVRNAADHGIESASERHIKGKPLKGLITLKAYCHNRRLWVELSDDGRGLDVDKIKAKAIQMGLLTPARAQALVPSDIHQFIFCPGFSTSTEVTTMSGRGVGMDVVRTNIQEIGGGIDVESREGKGCTFKIILPTDQD